MIIHFFLVSSLTIISWITRVQIEVSVTNYSQPVDENWETFAFCSKFLWFKVFFDLGA